MYKSPINHLTAETRADPCQQCGIYSYVANFLTLCLATCLFQTKLPLNYPAPLLENGKWNADNTSSEKNPITSHSHQRWQHLESGSTVPQRETPTSCTLSCGGHPRSCKMHMKGAWKSSKHCLALPWYPYSCLGSTRCLGSHASSWLLWEGPDAISLSLFRWRWWQLGGCARPCSQDIQFHTTTVIASECPQSPSALIAKQSWNSVLLTSAAKSCVCRGEGCLSFNSLCSYHKLGNDHFWLSRYCSGPPHFEHQIPPLP